jgi:hypothetical protein
MNHSSKLIVSHVSKEIPKPCIAKTDIHVYTIMDENNVSPAGFAFEKNKLYRTRKALRGEVMEFKGVKRLNKTAVKNGFYAFTNPKRAQLEMLRNIFAHSKTYKIVWVTIPAGARYYHGIDGDIISTSLRTNVLSFT